MTPDERIDRIAKELYVGEIPDVWNLIARALIRQEIVGAVEESLRAHRTINCCESCTETKTYRKVLLTLLKLKGPCHSCIVTCLDAIRSRARQ